MSCRRVGQIVIVFEVARLLLHGATVRRWSVECSGVDVTAAAAPGEAGTSVEINVVALGGPLRLRVALEGGEARLSNSSTGEWKGRTGDLYLTNGARRLAMASPMTIEGASVYLPAEAGAEIAGLGLAIDQAEHRVKLGNRELPKTAPAWESITIAKTTEEIAETERVSGTSSSFHGAIAALKLFPPPETDSFRVELAQGYVVGADFGSEWQGSGKIKGLQTDFSAFVTEGLRGIRALNGRVVIGDPEAGWELSGGDLFSEVWGVARGFRYTRRLSKRIRPSIGIFLPPRGSPGKGPILLMAQEFQVTPWFDLGGEAGSDRSYSAKSLVQLRRFTFYGYYRHSQQEFGEGYGGAASLNVFRNVRLQARYARSQAREGQIDWRTVSVQLPLPRRANLTLEHDWLDSAVSHQQLNSANLSVSVGHVRLNFRYQLQDKHSQLALGGLLALQQNQVVSSASYSNRRFSFDLQTAAIWQRSGSVSDWRQLIATYRLSERTSLQWVTAVPNITVAEQMRLRVTHAVTPHLALAVDFGNIPSYQEQANPVQAGGPNQGSRGLRLTIRKDWAVKSPTRGGELSGSVRDSHQKPVSSAVVQLGPYTAATDSAGQYRFQKVPPGDWKVTLDEKSIPADFAVPADEFMFHNRKSEKRNVDFAVTSLDLIQGCVYIDDNQDGVRGEGEGQQGVAVYADRRVTATGADGCFAFYNSPPGEYRVRLNLDVLARDLEPAGVTERAVELLAGKPATVVDFVLRRKVKAVVFQEMPPK